MHPVGWLHRNSVLCLPYAGSPTASSTGAFNRRDLVRMVRTTLDDEVEGPDAHVMLGTLEALGHAQNGQDDQQADLAHDHMATTRRRQESNTEEEI